MTTVSPRPRRANLLRSPSARAGIKGTAYDTAWLASVPCPTNKRTPRFPAAYQWLLDHQHADGSWGGSIRYEHDRLLSTLAALVPIQRFGHQGRERAAIEAGTRYLWQRAHLLTAEAVPLVGFELLFPALVGQAQAAGIEIPPHLDAYRAEREEKLRLIPPSALYAPTATVVHSLEFLGTSASLDGLRRAQGGNGSIGSSPAATAFYLSLIEDESADAYLSASQRHGGGAAVPVLHPCERFELLWAAYHLTWGGVPANLLLTAEDRAELRRSLETGGVSLSAEFPIPDADDTAVALLLLRSVGEAVSSGVLQPFALPDGHFASFPFERHPSVGVNLHVLEALLHVPGYPERGRTVERLVDYLVQDSATPYWIDKWHVSPYYATSHAIRVLAQVPSRLAPRVQRRLDQARCWLRRTQNEDGSWGFYGEGTAEEPAYALLALSVSLRVEDRERCAAGRRYLRAAVGDTHTSDHQDFPPLWVDKCLYTPTLIVRAASEAACEATGRSTRAPWRATPQSAGGHRAEKECRDAA